jgi:poly-gamma-glutamate synthesis protein (capsule biosynthesis protein)
MRPDTLSPGRFARTALHLVAAIALGVHACSIAPPSGDSASPRGAESGHTASFLGASPSGTSPNGDSLSPPSGSTAAVPTAPSGDPPAASITLVACGDISFGRDLGQILLREPGHDFFSAVAPLLASGDVRFANLESQLSDQHGQTQSPWVKLVFTGPPEGAGALSRAGFDVVSLANNHAWDYGKKALLETLDNLDRAGVAHAGTGRSRAEAYRPAIVERKGFRVAVLAVTDIWNQGPLRKHAAAEHVAAADLEALAAAVKEARARTGVDAVVVSHHGGVEFLDLPLQRTRALLRAAIEAGADAVIGHHPHVAQGIEWYMGRPILYSLGNLVMQMSEGRPAPSGYVARLSLRRGEPPAVEACPLRFPGNLGKPLTGHPQREALEKRFFGRLARISAVLGGIEIGPTGEDGCAPVWTRGEAPEKMRP